MKNVILILLGLILYCRFNLGTFTSLSHKILYTIPKGDMLHQIVQNYEVLVSQLKKWNRLESSKIYIDQILHISLDRFFTVEESLVIPPSSGERLPFKSND